MTANEIRKVAATTWSNPDTNDSKLRTALCIAADRIEALELELAETRKDRDEYRKSMLDALPSADDGH